ncbi:telomeric repeat-binding factor 2-interacting protein 1-like isoform X2 [Liolophura sinensis]
MANYRVTTRSKADMSGEIGDVDDDLSHASVIIKTVSRDRKGRKKFSLADDRNIIKFLMEEHRYARMKGNAVWKDMEILKITDHTYQSMKDRFKKQILPNIRSYNIPKPWISALTGLTADARTSPVPGKSQPAVRGFSPLSGFMDGMSTRSSSRSPRQSTPKKTQAVSNHPEPDNHSRSDEPHDPKITKQSSLDSTLETNNTESTIRTGQSKSKAAEVLDQSDEDEFDKELYRISVVDTEGDVDTEKTSTEDVYITNRTVSGSPAKDQNEKAKDKGNLQKVERRSLRLRHGQQSDKRDNPVRSSVLALRSSPRKKISTKSDDSFKKSGSGQRIMSKGKQAMPKHTSPTRGQKRKSSPEKPTGRESNPERSQAASPDRPLQPASPNKQVGQQ